MPVRRDLQHWLNEHEAHRQVMEKAPLMADLEKADQRRRLITQEFSRLHATFQLLHNHFQDLITEGETAEERAKSDLTQTAEEYRQRLQTIADAKLTADARIKQARRAIEDLDARKREYEKNDIAGKIIQIDSMAAWDAELKPFKHQLADLEKEVKSLSEIFAAMETEAKSQARDRVTEWDGKKPGIYEAFAKRKEALTEAHAETLKSIRLRHETELETANTKITEFKTQQAALGVEVKQVQADPEALQFLAIERQKQTDANDGCPIFTTRPMGSRKPTTNSGATTTIWSCRLTGENAIEKAETELEELLAADSAGDDTFLGFLRRNKPNWAADIGRVVSPETLLRTDLAPVLAMEALFTAYPSIWINSRRDVTRPKKPSSRKSNWSGPVWTNVKRKWPRTGNCWPRRRRPWVRQRTPSACTMPRSPPRRTGNRPRIPPSRRPCCASNKVRKAPWPRPKQRLMPAWRILRWPFAPRSP